MGGRGHHNNVKGYLDSSGRTKEYKKVFESGDSNLEFIEDVVSPINPKNPEFSNSANKIYVLIGKNGKPKSIIFYGEDHTQVKVIALDHSHGKLKEHVDIGFNDTKREARRLTDVEKDYIKYVMNIFNSKNKGGLLND